MSHRPDASPSSPQATDSGARGEEEIRNYLQQAEIIKRLNLKVEKLETENILLEKKIQSLDNPEFEDEGLPGSKQTAEENQKKKESRRNRKHQRKEDPDNDLDTVMLEKLELQEQLQRQHRESQTLTDENQGLRSENENLKRSLEDAKNALQDRYEEETTPKNVEVSSDNPPYSPPLVAADDNYVKSLGRELHQPGDESEIGEEQHREKQRSSASSPEICIDVANSSSVNFPPRARQRQPSWHCITEEKASPKDAPSTLMEKYRTVKISSRVHWARLLLWFLCMFLCITGSVMIAVGYNSWQEGQKQQKIWLEANGLTRAYMLTVAATTGVD